MDKLFDKDVRFVRCIIACFYMFTLTRYNDAPVDEVYSMFESILSRYRFKSVESKCNINSDKKNRIIRIYVKKILRERTGSQRQINILISAYHHITKDEPMQDHIYISGQCSRDIVACCRGVGELQAKLCRHQRATMRFIIEKLDASEIILRKEEHTH